MRNWITIVLLILCFMGVAQQRVINYSFTLQNPDENTILYNKTDLPIQITFTNHGPDTVKKIDYYWLDIVTAVTIENAIYLQFGKDLAPGDSIVLSYTYRLKVATLPTDSTRFCVGVPRLHSVTSDSIKLVYKNNRQCYRLAYVEAAAIGAEPLDKSVAKLYPNPTSSLLYVENLEVGDKVSFANLTGQVQLEWENGSLGKQSIIPLTELHKGLYFVTIKTNGSQTTHKLVVE